MPMTRRILGLDIEEHSILAAELRVDREQYELRRTAEFVFPEDISFDEPDRLGQLLRQFLRKNHFSAKNAVLGIPAKWLIVREENIPPTNTDSLAGILRIQAERHFSLDYNDLVFDYSGEVSPTKTSSLTLVAALRRKIEQVVTTVQAAGLSALSVTSSSLAFAWAFGWGRSASGYALYIRPNYAEFLVQKDKCFRLIRHLPIAVSSYQDAKVGVDALASEVRRIISFLPDSQNKSNSEKLLIGNAANIEPEALQTFTECFPRQVKVIDGSANLTIKKLEESDGPEMNRFTAAISLALAGKQPNLLAIDFLNSHINPQKKMANAKQILWAAVVGIVLFLCCLFVFLDWQNDVEEVAALRSRMENMKEDITEAESVVQKVSFARGWYSGRARFLDCLKELTLKFPTEGRIWTASLAIREDMQGIISGKSLDEKSVLEVLDALKESEVFSDVQMLYMRDAGRNSKEVSFAINFVFVDGE